MPREIASVGDTARHLATHTPGALKRPHEGWTQAEVEEIIRRLMREHLGITEFRWEQHFVKDLRVD